MKSVSEKWIEHQKQNILNESFVEILYSVTDPEAMTDIRVSDNGAIYFSNTQNIISPVELEFKPYQTLEQNIWVLNGELKQIPNIEQPFDDVGYVSESLSDEQGNFNEEIPPVLSINFSRLHENPIPALTIIWNESHKEFASKFVVEVYNGEILTTSKEFQNSDVISVVYMDINNYTKIEIKILKWCLPHHRARAEKVFVGLTKIFKKRDLFDFTYSNDVHPISSELPKSEIAFSVNNISGLYNPYNDNGFTRYMIKRQELSVRYGYKLSDSIEWIKAGVFYLSEWDNTQDGLGANFKARDLLEFATGITTIGKFDAEGTSLYSIGEKLFQSMNLAQNSDGTNKWHIDESLKNIKTKAALPKVSVAQGLQMVANASKCVLYQDENGTIKIQPLVMIINEDYKIDNFNSLRKSELTVNKPIKEVKVAINAYIPENEFTALYSENIQIQEERVFEITFAESYTNVTVEVSTDFTKEEIEITSLHCKFKVIGNGEVNISVRGKKINNSKTFVSREIERDGKVVTVDNPLITSTEMANNILDWVSEYVTNRITVRSNIRPDIRLETLDVIKSVTDYTSNDILVKSLFLRYNGAFNADVEGKVI